MQTWIRPWPWPSGTYSLPKQTDLQTRAAKNPERYSGNTDPPQRGGQVCILGGGFGKNPWRIPKGVMLELSLRKKMRTFLVIGGEQGGGIPQKAQMCIWCWVNPHADHAFETPPGQEWSGEVFTSLLGPQCLAYRGAPVDIWMIGNKGPKVPHV